MLVSAKEMLEKAKAGHYAVGQFNINKVCSPDSRRVTVSGNPWCFRGRW